MRVDVESLSQSATRECCVTLERFSHPIPPTIADRTPLDGLLVTSHPDILPLSLLRLGMIHRISHRSLQEVTIILLGITQF